MKVRNPIVILDFETTGVDTSKDRIVQAAFLKIQPTGVTSKFTTLVNPLIPIDSDATKIHGITDDDIKEAPTFKDIADDILKYIKGCDLVTYNGNKFDLPLLLAELNRVNKKIDLDDIQLIDVMLIETMINPRTLSEVYKRLTGETLENAHDAMADVNATFEILKHHMKYLSGKVEFENIENYCREGKARTDIAGLFKYNDAGELCWNFGKYKKCPINTDIGYQDWFLRSDFPQESKDFLLKH